MKCGFWPLTVIIFTVFLCYWGMPGYAQVASQTSDSKTSGASSSVTSDVVSSALAKARAFALQNTHEPLTPLGKFAAAQLLRFGKAMGISPEQLANPKVGFQGAFVKAVTNHWVYQFNASGEQTFRPISNVPLMSSELSRNNQSSLLENGGDPLVSASKALASKLGCGDEATYSSTVKKQEVLFIAECKNPQDSLQSCSGRSLVRLKGDGNTYFQVIFDGDTPVRADTNYQSEPMKNEVGLLIKQIQSGNSLPAPKELDGNLAVGTFFDPSQYDFECSAVSWEGSPYLDPKLTNNPFQRGNFDAAPFLPVNGSFDGLRTDLVDYQAWANTEDGKWYKFYEFAKDNGREGGLRGTFNSKTQSWSIPGITTVHHPLKDYGIVGGEPTATNSFILSDNQSHTFPYDPYCQLEPRFYQDLEACTAAVFCSHGGSNRDTVRMRRGLDVWFEIGNASSKFGSGQLRHIFLTGCSTADCFNTAKGDSRTLLSYWLTARYVEGLQTMCGFDGLSTGGGVMGFRFTDGYNEQESISDSWWRGMINECDANNPVTVSYGATRDEAINILGDGRFSKERSTPTFAAASVWKNM